MFILNILAFSMGFRFFIFLAIGFWDISFRVLVFSAFRFLVDYISGF